MVAGSLVLHLVLLLATLIAWQHVRPPAEEMPPPAIAVVFQGGSNRPPSAPNPTRASEIPRGEESRNTERGAVPRPAIRPPPEPLPPPAARPSPPPPTPVPPPPQATVAPHVPPTPPTLPKPPTESHAAPTPPAQSAPPVPDASAAMPEVNLALPELPPPPTLAPVPQPQLRPPPLPLARLPSRPVPRPPTRYAPSRLRNSNPFAAPMDLSFAPAGPSHPARGARSSHGIDLAMGPVIKGGKLLDPVAHMVTPGATADWRNALEAWVDARKYYPEQAAEQGEDGAATVRVTIAHDGTVRSVWLIGSSGSHWLDAAWVAVFRDQKVPPLPDDMKQSEFTFEFTMNYVLVRQ